MYPDPFAEAIKKSGIHDKSNVVTVKNDLLKFIYQMEILEYHLSMKDEGFLAMAFFDWYLMDQCLGDLNNPDFEKIKRNKDGDKIFGIYFLALSKLNIKEKQYDMESEKVNFKRNEDIKN